MKTIVARIDNKTLQTLDEIAQGKPRSEVIRTALRQYIARYRMAERKRQVDEYMQDAGASEEMSTLAEADMDHAAELLLKAEGE